jgi:osmotically inducible protein OsmC
MPDRKAQASWNGTLKEGDGTMKFGSGAYEGAYTWSSRFEEAKGTNPEELIAAAHAGCFSMALSGDLVKAGFTPTRISTDATVHLTKEEAGWTISSIDLRTEAAVPGIDEAKLQEIAGGTSQKCPVSRALGSVTIRADVKLVN